MARLGVGIDVVGRGRELTELEAALQSAASGRPSGILLAGDAGVGKSRMVGETVARAGESHFTVLVGRCLDTADAALPYLPFTEIVASLAAARPEIVAERPALRSLLPGTVVRDDAAGDDRALGQLRVFDAVLSALDALSAVSPALLVVEDLHWADRSSRDLLIFLLSHLTAQRLVVLATYRRDDLHRRHPLRPVLSELVRLPAVERLELEPLGGDESLELVRRLADGSVAESRLRHIARRSEGNAFFAEELVTAAPAGVPEGLAEVLMARIEALPATAQRVLRIAAVSGRKVRHEVLAAVSDLGDDELEQALRDAVAHHVLVPDRDTCAAAGPGTDGYVFRHALLREAIYQELLPGERTRLHARYAQRLAERAGTSGVAAELAHHAYAGHDLPRALAASIAAAREADTRDAPAEVLFQLERALELWHAVPEAEDVAGLLEPKITRWAAKYASFTGDPERAAQLGRRSVEVAEAQHDDIAIAGNARNYAMLLLDLPGREQEALATAQKALAIVEGDPPSGEVAWAHATLARTLWRTDRATEADQQARMAVAVVDAITEPGQIAVGAKADALVTMSIYAQHLGEEERARQLIIEARELAHRSDHLTVELRSHYNLGMSLLEAGRLTDAEAEFAEGEARADGVGLSWSGYGIDLRVTHLVTQYLAGEWDAAEAASRFAGRMGPATVAVRLAAAGMPVDTARGRLAAVEEQLVAVAEQQPFLDDQVIVLTGMAGAEAALWAGAPATAAARVDEAIRTLQAMEPRHMAAIALSAIGVAAQAALLEAGTVPAAQARADGERLAAIAEDTAANGNPRASTLGPEGLAWLSWVRAELTRLTGPDPEAWSRVVEAFAYEGGRPSAPGYRQAFGLLRRAEARLAGGETAAAVIEDLQAAHATALRLGAAPLAAAVATTSRRAGVRLGSTTASAPSADPFTPRERAVLGLVAEGRTNRQVGAELFISEKTVSVHLSRVMAKLGASSRTEAVSVAYARGLVPAGKGSIGAG